MFGNSKIKLIKTNFGKADPEVKPLPPNVKVSKSDHSNTTTASSIMNEIVEIENASTYQLSVVKGHVRVSMPRIIGESFLHTNYHEFKETFEGINLEITLTDHFLDELPKHTDIVITHKNLQRSALCDKIVGELECGLYGPESFENPIVNNPKNLKLDHYSCIHYLEYHPEWHFSDNKIKHTINTHRSLTINEFDAVIEEVKNGEGLAVLPRALVDEKKPAIKRLFPAFHCNPLILHGFYDLKSPDKSALQVFLEFLVRRSFRV